MFQVICPFPFKRLIGRSFVFVYNNATSRLEKEYNDDDGNVDDDDADDNDGGDDDHGDAIVMSFVLLFSNVVHVFSFYIALTFCCVLCDVTRYLEYGTPLFLSKSIYMNNG